MNPGKRKILIRASLLCAAAVVLLCAGVRLLGLDPGEPYQEVRGADTPAFLRSGAVNRDGVEYRKIPAVTTILVAGIDRETGEGQGVGTSRYRNGGQADYLLLIAIDHSNRRISQLEIDRDTMTDVTVLSVFGKETGTRIMQICLAHSYGANQEENARYTVRAVRGLMNSIEIDGYYMVDYTAIPALNDALGGVAVTVPDDMTSVNPLWTQGSRIRLKGGEAEAFVRSRRTVGEGTNAERMIRQREFTQNAIAQMRSRLSQDAAFGAQLLAALKKCAVTSLSDQMLLEEVRRASGYDILPADTLAGEYTVGESGYMEFRVREGSVENWILTNLYTKE